MITKAQALDESIREFHYGPRCDQIVDANTSVSKMAKPHPKSRPNVERWRRNGATKTWKTRPNEFRIPVKWGLRDYSYITELNAHEFHVIDDCPLNVSVDEVIRNW